MSVYEPINVEELAKQAEIEQPRVLHFVRGIYSATTMREILYIEKIRRKYFAGVNIGYPNAIITLFTKIKGSFEFFDEIEKREFEHNWISVVEVPN